MEFINNEVLECARYGEHEELAEFLRQGGDPNYADANGTTALHKGIQNISNQCTTQFSLILYQL